MSDKNISLISVIVPVYNSERYLSKCIESILNQSFKNIELILVDDGSTDGSGHLCDLYASNDKRIKVIHQINKGAGAARNTGINAALSEFITFIDSDDWIDTRAYENILPFISDDVDLIVFGRYDYVNGVVYDGICPTEYERKNNVETIRDLLHSNGSDLSQCDKIYRRHLWNNVLYPKNLLSEDVAVLCKPISKIRYSIFVPHRFYYYNHHNNSRSTTISIDGWFSAELSFRIMFNYVSKQFPELTNDAIVPYFKMLKNIIHMFEMMDNRTFRNYKSRYVEYKKTLKKITIFLSDHDDIKLVNSYIFNTLRIKYKIRKSLTFIKKTIKYFIILFSFSKT